MSDWIFLRSPQGRKFHAVNTATMRGRCGSTAGKDAPAWHPEPGDAATCPQCLRIMAGIWDKNTPTAESWAAMKNRCKNPSHVAYPRYGGRGIKVCERWAGSDGLRYFIEDMGERPPGMTLDRIDTNGDYCPENCRWADMKTQHRNRRDIPKLVLYGKAQTLADWADEYHIPVRLVWQRMKKYGWTLEEALTMEVVKANGDKGVRGGWKRVPRADLPKNSRA
jgi:hypothetical protein